MNKNTAPGRKRFNFSTVMLLVVILALMFFAISLATDKFLTLSNMQNLVRQTAISGVIAIGMTIVIISAGIELSVGATAGLSGVLCAIFMGTLGWPIFLSVVASVLLATLVGVFNGAMIHDGKVPPFIATLGCMTAVRGVIMLITNARMISGLPKTFVTFAKSTFLGVPMLGLVWFIIILASFIIIRYTTFGRNIFAFGSNPEAARLSGINIRATTYGVYIYCALLSAIAGVMMTARLGNGVPTGGMGYETDAIAAAVIGGASLMGAEGSIIGTVLGSLIMATLRNGGNLLGVNSFVLEIVIGLLIVFAVLLDKRRRR